MTKAENAEQLERSALGIVLANVAHVMCFMLFDTTSCNVLYQVSTSGVKNRTKLL